MSRLQAHLYRDGDHWLIENLGGRNPTLLNGKPIAQPARVGPGDLITVSDTRVYVESPGVDAAPPLSREDPTDAAHTLFRPAHALLAAGAGQGLRADISDAGLVHHTERLRRLNEFHRALAAPITLEAPSS